MTHRAGHRSSRRAGWGRRGFTLIEMLAALSVLSAGSIIFVALFFATLGQAQEARNLKAASDLAQARLDDLTRNGAGYAWPGFSQLQPGTLQEVTLGEAGVAQVCIAPSVMPLDDVARKREEAFFSKFFWEAYVQLPRADAAYVELTAVIRWEHRGRQRLYALTTCMARRAPEGGS